MAIAIGRLILDIASRVKSGLDGLPEMAEAPGQGSELSRTLKAVRNTIQPVLGNNQRYPAERLRDLKNVLEQCDRFIRDYRSSREYFLGRVQDGFIAKKRNDLDSLTRQLQGALHNLQMAMIIRIDENVEEIHQMMRARHDAGVPMAPRGSVSYIASTTPAEPLSLQRQYSYRRSQTHSTTRSGRSLSARKTRYGTAQGSTYNTIWDGSRVDTGRTSRSYSPSTTRFGTAVESGHNTGTRTHTGRTSVPEQSASTTRLGTAVASGYHTSTHTGGTSLLRQSANTTRSRTSRSSGFYAR